MTYHLSVFFPTNIRWEICHLVLNSPGTFVPGSVHCSSALCLLIYVLSDIFSMMCYYMYLYLLHFVSFCFEFQMKIYRLSHFISELLYLSTLSILTCCFIKQSDRGHCYLSIIILQNIDKTTKCTWTDFLWKAGDKTFTLRKPRDAIDTCLEVSQLSEKGKLGQHWHLELRQRSEEKRWLGERTKK